MYDPFNENQQRFLIDQKRLRASHQRCLKARVDPEQTKIADIWVGKQLEKLQAKNSRLLSVSEDLFPLIHSLLPTQPYLFILTDRGARILSLFSTPGVIYSYADKGIRPGAFLSEKSCGANAAALAIRYRERSILRGAQHYCRLFHESCCIAVPIINPSNNSVVACVELAISHKAEVGEKVPLLELLANKFTAIFSSKVGAPAQLICFEDVCLSVRQKTVLEMVMQGLTSKEIGTALTISSRTVESHLEAMRKNLKAKTTAHLISIILSSRSGSF